MGQNVDRSVINESRNRITQLIADAEREPHASKEHLERFVQELSTALEELVVADEELRAQTEELASSVMAIDAERERYGALFEFAPDAYLLTDTQGKILEANGAASEMLNVPVRFVEGKLLFSYVGEGSVRDVRGMVTELATGGPAVADRYVTMQPRDGQAFMAEVRAAAGEQRNEPVIRWMVRDITNRLRLEEEVRFLHSEVELLGSLAQVARLTAEPQSRDALLDRVVTLAAQALPGCEVSLAMEEHGQARFAASSGERARRLDGAEDAQGDGPCVAALRADVVVETRLDDAARRWPGFGAAARDVGLVAAFGHPMSTPSGQRGALNIYAFAELTEGARALIPLIVDQAVVALTNAELYEGAQTLASHLQKALESRGVIEQAKGVLIARQGCTDEQAFDILRRASQRLNRKLRDVAADLVAHVQTPKPSGADPRSPLAAEAEASITRAQVREVRALDRADQERRRADAARASDVPARRQDAVAHDRARAVHEQAAALQRRHQREVLTGEHLPVDAPSPPIPSS